MTQIFVVTAGNPEARRHLEHSVEHPIPNEMVFETFPSTYQSDLERILEEGNELRDEVYAAVHEGTAWQWASRSARTT